MTFKFTKEDKINELPAPIKAHFKNFLNNRISQVESLEEAIEDEDFEEIRLFCHAQLGVAGSYKCHKLDELTRYIQHHARKEQLRPIKEVIPTLKDYLQGLKLDKLDK